MSTHEVSSSRRDKFIQVGWIPMIVGVLGVATYLYTTNDVIVRALVVFGIAVVMFALEDEFGINKAPTAIAAGVWIMLLASGVLGSEHFEEETLMIGGEIIQITAFLFAAVLNAATIVHHKAFDRLRTAIFVRGWDDRKQFTVIVLMVAGLSAVVDNLTATVIGLQMALLFFSNKKNLLYTSIAIIIAANAGGAPSPVGDITTTILWIAGKYKTFEIVAFGLLPNLMMLAIPMWYLRRQLEDVENGDAKTELVEKLTLHQKAVIVAGFSAFTLPVILETAFGLPPWMSLTLGFSLVWIIAESPNTIRKFKNRVTGNGHDEDETSLDISIEHLLREEVTIGEILFFTGVLLMVSGLRLTGGLEPIAQLVYGGINPPEGRLIIGHIVMGLLSSVFDNIPLVEMVKQMLTVGPGNTWVLLASTAGNGGSLLLYGSAAGVVAYGILKKAGLYVGYFQYMKIVTKPVLLGYAAMVITWTVEHYIVLAALGLH